MWPYVLSLNFIELAVFKVLGLAHFYLHSSISVMSGNSARSRFLKILTLDIFQNDFQKICLFGNLKKLCEFVSGEYGRCSKMNFFYSQKLPC